MKSYLSLTACRVFVTHLAKFLDNHDFDKEEGNANLQTLKMSVYLLCQFMELFDSDAIRPTALVTKVC